MMYYFLCASLPTPVFGRPAALTPAEFLNRCRGEVSEADFAELEQATLRVPPDPEYSETLSGAAASYAKFEQYLRTRIAERRSAARKPDEAEMKPLPVPAEFFSEADYALSQTAAAGPVERGEIIDRIRWTKLDDLEAGHDFDLDKLIVLKLKYDILAGYARRDAASGGENFNAAADRISSAGSSNGQSSQKREQQ